MFSLQEIKVAKQFGRLIQKSRENQGKKLPELSTECNLSMRHLVAIESGNFFAFHDGIDAFYNAYDIYAKHLNLDGNLAIKSQDNLENKEVKDDIDAFIPAYLRVRQCV